MLGTYVAGDNGPAIRPSLFRSHGWRFRLMAHLGHCGVSTRCPLLDLYTAVMEGAVERVRPKMMTVVAIMAGLLPIPWSHGTGSEVMRRIAVPMIGGMVSSTILTLIVIPAVYALVKGFNLERQPQAAPVMAE